MSLGFLKRGPEWLPTAIVLAVVLTAGGRLIDLSMREHITDTRKAAQTAVIRSARSLESSLPRLVATGANPSSGIIDHLSASLVLKRLATAGYDFEVSQVDPASRFRQVLLRSQTAPLSEPARSLVRPPVGFLQDTPRGHLELAIRPKAGWYPTRELATSVGLLAIVAWLLGFGTHDLTHSLQRSKAAAATLRQRLRSLNQRLTAEIDARQQLQQSFDHARYHDAFTGLPNRRYFMDRLDRALRDVRARLRQRIAIILIDVDRFRLINDTLGQTAGDELMVQAARRFEHATESIECVLARWGDDQFAALVLDVPSSETAFAIANAMQDTLQEPFELRKHRLTVSARMGVTSVESGLLRTEEALREADIALSVAKRHESAKTIAYLPTMGGDAASLVSLEADLHVALERNEFRLLFQPIVDLRGEQIVGAEALLRWKHPVEGLLSPNKFLAIAEEAGLLVSMTRWVILRVCRLAGDWRRRLPPDTPFYFSINLSATVLRDPGFVDYVALVLRETGMPTKAIKFELTEGGLISNVGAAREVLDRLHGMGIELMLDDFGTGYSSLSYLQLFPFDYLKIDRPFVNRTGSEQTNNGITSAVLQMASSLSLKTVAEVVETPAAARALAEMGCDFGQGYFFSEPLEAEEALERLRIQGLRVPNTVAVDPGDTIVTGPDDSPTLAIPVDWITENEPEEKPPPVIKRAR
jgi:diguanylate cyclase (GGDEF)-like protein